MLESDKMGDFLAAQTAIIEALPEDQRAAKAEFWRNDFERKELMLLEFAHDLRKTDPFGGTLTAFMTARAVNHFAAIAAKYRAPVSIAAE